MRWAASCCFTCPSTGDLLPTLSLVSATSRRFACLSRWRTCPHPGLFLSVCAVPPHVTERPRATTSATLPPVCCPCGSDGVNEQACFREAIAPTLVHGAKVFHWGTLHKARIGFLGLTVEHSSWTNFCLLRMPLQALTSAPSNPSGDRHAWSKIANRLPGLLRTVMRTRGVRAGKRAGKRRRRPRDAAHAAKHGGRRH